MVVECQFRQPLVVWHASARLHGTLESLAQMEIWEKKVKPTLYIGD